MEEEEVRRPTRRELFARAGRARARAAGGAGALSALSALGLGVAPAAAANTDADWLAVAYEAEHLSVLAYEYVLRLPVLGARARGVLHGLLAHEYEHVAVLAGDLRGLGARVPSPPRAIAQVGETLDKHGMNGALATARTRKEALQLLLDVEALCEGAYYRAAGNLAAVGPLVHAAQALAGDAQHTTILQGLLHPGDITQAVPDWYVGGVA